MKTIQILVIIFVINSSQLTFSQSDKTVSTGPIPKMKTERIHTIINKLDNPATTALAYDNASQQTLTMPLPAGTPFTYLTAWAQPVFASSMCKGGDENYYLTDIGPPPTLWQVDPTTGAVTPLGSITGMGSDQPNGISFNPANGTYYMVSSSSFYSLDINTWVATLIGSFSITGLMIDLCFDGSGTCYAYDVDITPGAANGYIIDITTGAITPLGYVGFTPNYGQGMGYDYETNTIYLSAFNYDTFSAQLRTMDPNTGMTTLLTDWGGSVQIAPFSVIIPCMSPVGQPSDPNPPTGATNIPVAGVTLGWTNGVGTVNCEVWFGPVSNVQMVYDGSAITSWTLDTLLYSTDYRWRIKDKDTICGGAWGPSWTFTTELNPNFVVDTVTVYPMSAQYWTGTTDSLTKTDGEVNTIYPNDGWMVFDVSYLPPSTAFIDAIQFYGYVNATNWPYWSATPMGGVNPITDPAASIYAQINSGYNQGTAYIYSDEGSGFSVGWHDYPLEAGATTDFLNAIPQGWFAMGFVDRDFTATYYLNFDGWNSSNPPYLVVIYEYSVSVELTSFTASVNKSDVTLNWNTSTETNNQGFDIERSLANTQAHNWEKIGYVAGFGTTTEPKAYSFVDTKLETGTYVYRLKQIDFDGTFKYSNEVNVDVEVPIEYALEQNYPNPFNPVTQIRYALPQTSQVIIKVYDVLGNEIATLVNEEKPAGFYELTWNAANLPSGVYFYQLKATPSGGQADSFVETKKMVLMK